MSFLKKNWKKIFLTIIIVGLIYGGFYLSKALPIANGFNAKIICSCVFESGRSDSSCLEDGINLYGLIDKKIDHEKKQVTASVFGMFKRTALYRDGMGSVLYDDWMEQPLQTFGKPSLDEFKLSDTILWPYGNKVEVNTKMKVVDYTKIKEAVDYAFSEPNKEMKRNTRAILIIYNDSIIAERYADGFNENTKFLGWSMTKSILATVIGIMKKDGLITLEDKNLFPEWKNDERKNITVDDLLHMRSGLYFEEEYMKPSLANNMLFNSYTVTHLPLIQPLSNKTWYYSSGTTNLLSKKIEEKFNVKTFDYIYRRLVYKIGMTSMTLEGDAAGYWVGSSFAHATARDWGKFGMLYLHDGVWNNERILPEGWTNYVATPEPTSDSLKYGAHFWLNGTLDKTKPSTRWPELPNDIYLASGFKGQNVVIIPSKKLVVVRLGNSSETAAWDLRGFLNKVVKAVE